MSARKNETEHAELVGKQTNQTLRQDRHASDGSLVLELQGTKCTVLNYSLFGLAISSPIDLAVGDLLPDAKLYSSTDLIGEHALIVKRRSKLDFGFEYGLEVLTDTIPVDKINLINELRASLSKIQEKAEATHPLPLEFKYHVFSMRAQLSQVEALCQNYESRPWANKVEREEAFEAIANRVGGEMYSQVKIVNQTLQSLIQDQPEATLKLGFQFFRDILGHYIFQSPFTKRSYEKPRGYAGDFEMMNQIYRNDNHALTLFGSCMERAVHLHEEPSAVRNRSQYLATKIVDHVHANPGKLDFISIACGPAEEVKLAIELLDQKQLDRVTFWMLDQDEEALKYAQRNSAARALALGKTVNLRFSNRGIKEVILQGMGDQSFDLIYSAGLFDYFSDPVAIRAGKVLAKALRPKGRMIIGNFNITSPNWFGMLSLFDWRLILRSETDLSRLFKQDGFAFDVESEPANVNLFCVLERK